VTILHTI